MEKDATRPVKAHESNARTVTTITRASPKTRELTKPRADEQDPGYRYLLMGGMQLAGIGVAPIDRSTCIRQTLWQPRNERGVRYVK